MDEGNEGQRDEGEEISIGKQNKYGRLKGMTHFDMENMETVSSTDTAVTRKTRQNSSICKYCILLIFV